MFFNRQKAMLCTVALRQSILRLTTVQLTVSVAMPGHFQVLWAYYLWGVALRFWGSLTWKCVRTMRSSTLDNIRQLSCTDLPQWPFFRLIFFKDLAACFPILKHGNTLFWFQRQQRLHVGCTQTSVTVLQVASSAMCCPTTTGYMFVTGMHEQQGRELKELWSHCCSHGERHPHSHTQSIMQHRRCVQTAGSWRHSHAHTDTHTQTHTI